MGVSYAARIEPQRVIAVLRAARNLGHLIVTELDSSDSGRKQMTDNRTSVAELTECIDVFDACVETVERYDATIGGIDLGPSYQQVQGIVSRVTGYGNESLLSALGYVLYIPYFSRASLPNNVEWRLIGVIVDELRAAVDVLLRCGLDPSRVGGALAAAIGGDERHGPVVCAMCADGWEFPESAIAAMLVD